MDENARNANREWQRKIILQALVLFDLDWVSFDQLRTQVDSLQAARIEDEALMFHLRYLSDRGYIETKQLRPGRGGLTMSIVRATSKAADLLDGRIERDPGVAQ